MIPESVFGARTKVVGGFIHRLPPATDNVGVKPHGPQLSNGLLRGLGLLLPDAAQYRHKRNVDQRHAVPPDAELKLP